MTYFTLLFAILSTTYATTCEDIHAIYHDASCCTSSPNTSASVETVKVTSQTAIYSAIWSAYWNGAFAGPDDLPAGLITNGSTYTQQKSAYKTDVMMFVAKEGKDVVQVVNSVIDRSKNPPTVSTDIGFLQTSGTDKKVLSITFPHQYPSPVSEEGFDVGDYHAGAGTYALKFNPTTNTLDFASFGFLEVNLRTEADCTTMKSKFIDYTVSDLTANGLPIPGYSTSDTLLQKATKIAPFFCATNLFDGDMTTQAPGCGVDYILGELLFCSTQLGGFNVGLPPAFAGSKTFRFSP
jgi:hypothetical protein